MFRTSYDFRRNARQLADPRQLPVRGLPPQGRDGVLLFSPPAASNGGNPALFLEGVQRPIQRPRPQRQPSACFFLNELHDGIAVAGRVQGQQDIKGHLCQRAALCVIPHSIPSYYVYCNNYISKRNICQGALGKIPPAGQIQ